MTMARGRKEGFYVDPLSERDIQMAAQNVRELFFPVEHCYLDVVQLIEHKIPTLYPRVHLEVVPDYSLPDREAEFDPVTFAIRVRESVYAAACNRDGHSRDTLAHELAHFFLHRFQNPTFGRTDSNGTIPYHCNSEWQADTFARHLLVPKHLAGNMTTEEIMVKFEVSRKVASIVSGNHSILKQAPKQMQQEELLPGVNWNAC